MTVAPGADPGTVRLAVSGADELRLSPQGDLVMGTPAGDVVQSAPIAYQLVGGTSQPVPVRFVLHPDHQVGFHVGAWDRSRPLVIDPVLAFSTFLGGSGEDAGSAIALDDDGNAYLAGETESPDFPTVATSRGGSNDDRDGNGVCRRVVGQMACRDVFVAKLNPAGKLVYATYLGGAGFDLGTGIAVRDSEVYLAGTTDSEDFPTTDDPYQRDFGRGDDDAFFARLSPAGDSLVYSTYLGGTTADSANGIALDTDGNAYLVGGTDGDFPTTDGALQPDFGGGVDDAFVAKFNPEGGLVYSTYLGGGACRLPNPDPCGDDPGLGIAVDDGGHAYVTGETSSVDFPITNDALQDTLGGERDAFVAKLAADGKALEYSTYLGGDGVEIGYAIAVRDGKARVTGETSSGDFPTVNAVQSAFGGGPSDVFVIRLDEDGEELEYSTYLGGGHVDLGLGIAVDGHGDTYVTGAASGGFPTVKAIQHRSRGGGDDLEALADDAFVAKFDGEGDALVYSTFLGGRAADAANGIAVDGEGNATVIGETDSRSFPTRRALQSRFGGGADPYGEPRDAFVAKISG